MKNILCQITINLISHNVFKIKAIKSNNFIFYNL